MFLMFINTFKNYLLKLRVNVWVIRKKKSFLISGSLRVYNNDFQKDIFYIKME